MAESKKPGSNPEETPEQIKLREEKEAQEKAEKEAVEKAERDLAEKIKAAQTRTEKTDEGEVKKRSKLLPVEKERHLFHVELETPAFDQKTGKKLSKSKVQIFNPSEWTNFKNNAQHLGFVYKILWNPEQYK